MRGQFGPIGGPKGTLKVRWLQKEDPNPPVSNDLFIILRGFGWYYALGVSHYQGPPIDDDGAGPGCRTTSEYKSDGF